MVLVVPPAAETVGHGRALVAEGAAGPVLWRLVVAQLLDDYASACRVDPASAAEMFDEEPPRTGHGGLDAAVAALAAWLADRDGWPVPAWARDPSRAARPFWFVTDSAYGRNWALAESPGHFRIRGVFITRGALERV